MRAQNAQDRLQLLLRSLDTRDHLSDADKTVQVLLGTGVVWVLNGFKDGLKKAHGGDRLCKATTGWWQELKIESQSCPLAESGLTQIKYLLNPLSHRPM